MLDDAAVFSILSKCFAPVDKAEWENLSAREAWAEFLDGARFILQNGGSLGLDKSPADYRRGNHAPLQDFLSECEVCALFCPPTYEEKRQFAARHFTGGLPESALPIESLYVNTAKAGDLLSPVDGKGMYLGASAATCPRSRSSWGSAFRPSSPIAPTIWLSSLTWSRCF